MKIVGTAVRLLGRSKNFMSLETSALKNISVFFSYFIAVVIATLLWLQNPFI